MKVLFVTNNYLHISGGGAFATRAIVNAFSQIVDSVRLLYPAQRGCKDPDINPKVETIPVYYDTPLFKKVINVYAGKIHRYYEVFEQYLDSIDTVVFDTSIVSHRLIDKVKNKHLRVITIHHNYQVEFARDDTPFLIKYPMLYWLSIAEKESVIKSDINICLTKSDKDALLANYCQESRMEVLGIFEVNEHKPLDISHRNQRGHNYIITGNLSVNQTTEALYPWIRYYYPILRKVDPSAKLVIAGYRPQDKLKTICKKEGIELIDTPESMEPYLLDADFYICPTNLGSGIKLRIMDGLSAGIPVITQKKSIRGYEDFEGSAVFTFEDKETFKELVEKLKCEVFDSGIIQRNYLNIFSFNEGVKRLKSILMSFDIR